MTLHLHHITGCSPTPLAFYLKGLGVLRVVGEQSDTEARGWWQDEHFCLLTRLDRGDLERFFTDDYEPTPFVSPWNKGSGFYKKSDEALKAIEASAAPRFSRFRAGIAAGRTELDELRAADEDVRALKDRTKKKKGMTAADVRAASRLKEDPTFRKDLSVAERRFKELKARLFVPCLRSWRGAHREWLDAALVWLEEGRVMWPSLLGTGGNDGNLDFTNNAMQECQSGSSSRWRWRRE
jgi:CRISPR-associated protein Csx17